MSGFDLAELLPFYLDETDEHVAPSMTLFYGLSKMLPMLELFKKRFGCSIASRALQSSWDFNRSIS